MVNNEIREFLQASCAALNKCKVEYLIIGGVAVGYYGYRRASVIKNRIEIKHDIDFWYRPLISNFEKLINALEILGADRSRLDQIVFDPKKTFLRIPQRNFQLEFLPQVSGCQQFQSCYSRSESITLDGNLIRIIGFDDLIANKKAMGRDFDLEDIRVLKALNAKKD